MTDKMIAESYAVAKKVFEKRIHLKEGVEYLEKLGMNPSSAAIYIQAYEAFRTGVLRQRTLSEKGYRYFLQHILDDFGKEAFKIALSSLKKLADYQKEKGLSYAQSTYRIYNEFLEEIE